MVLDMFSKKDLWLRDEIEHAYLHGIEGVDVGGIALQPASGCGFYPGPDGSHHVLQDRYGNAVWRLLSLLNPTCNKQEATAIQRTSLDPKSEGQERWCPDLTWASLRNCQAALREK
jgi:hypothetical protein